MVDSVDVVLLLTVSEGGFTFTDPRQVNLIGGTGEDLYETPLSAESLTDSGFVFGHLLIVNDATALADSSSTSMSASDQIDLSFTDSAALSDSGQANSVHETLTDSTEFKDTSNAPPPGADGTMNTAGGAATASGSSTSFTTPDGWFATAVSSAMASGEDSVFVLGGSFVTLPASINNAASGGAATFITALEFETETGSAAASGGIGWLWTPDGKFSTTVGAATAEGRTSSFFREGARAEAQVILTLSVDVSVARSAFQAPNPQLVPETSTQWEVTPWRLHQGLPRVDALYRTGLEVDSLLGERQTSAAFVSPDLSVTNAQYRWLAEDHATPQWDPSDVSTEVQLIRTWDDVRQEFTWTTMALRTWTQVLYDTLDPTIPAWLDSGSANSSLKSDYTYWRSGEYVTNPAVLVDAGVTLEMSWATGDFAQTTVMMVCVPHLPSLGRMELLRASPLLRLELTNSSELLLVNGVKTLSSAVIGTSRRPNEPIVVAMSVNTLSQRVAYAVMDTTIRVAQSDLYTPISTGDVSWAVGADEQARLEVLELAAYTDELDLTSLSTELAQYDKVYGVTVP